MSRYELARAALDDLDERWLYIAEDSLDAANRATDAILDACALLVDHPTWVIRVRISPTDLSCSGPAGST